MSAVFFQSLNKREAAIEKFNTVIEMDPSHIPSRVNLGALYCDSNEIVRAEACFKKAVSLGRKSLAVLKDQTSQFENNQQIQEIAPGYVEALNGLGMLHQKKEI